MKQVQQYSIIVLALFTSSFLFSTNYYVSPDGNDSNSGTIDNPYKTIGKAHYVVQAGDTIYVRGGNYMPNSQTWFAKGGTADAYIVLRSYPGELPVIDGEKVFADDATWSFNYASYWKIIGPFIVTNGRGAGVYINGAQNIEFHQVESSYNGKMLTRGAHGFMIWKGSDILFNNCDAHHNANHLWKGGEDQLLNQYQHGDGWRLFEGAKNIRFVGCRSWRNLDDNYDFLGTMVPIEFVDCWAAYAGKDDSLGSITGIPNFTVPSVEARGSIWGNGIKLGYNENPTNHQVIRCLTWNNNGAGLHMNKGPATILHTAIYGNRSHAIDYEDGNKHEIHNCWELGNSYDNADTVGVEPDLSLQSHNSWDSTLAVIVSEDDFMSVDDTGMLGPRQEDGSLPVTSFLQLAAGSDLMNAGIDVGLSFSGAAPDLGPYEVEELTGLAENAVEFPEKFSLVNYPNPFNANTVVNYHLPKAGNVEVTVFDLMGRKIIVLDSGHHQAGTHMLSWNARDENGQDVTSGVYLLHIQADNSVNTIKMSYIQ